MFTDTLNKVTQGYISHLPLRMIPSLVSKYFMIFYLLTLEWCIISLICFQSLTLKGKDSTSKYKERGEESPGYKNLLMLMVRLIHADPMLMLNVSKFFFFNFTMLEVLNY